MAKGQVTADDLATGMQSFGGLASLGGAPRPARDNPFRDTRSEPPAPAAAVLRAETAPEAPRLEVIAGAEKAEAGEGTGPLVPAEPRERKAARARPAERVKPPASAIPSESAAAVREKKTEVYTEKYSVFLNAELRDGAEALAKALHRSRTQKGERITANTVIRVALRAMLETFDPVASAGLNTEDEFYELVLRRWSRK